MNNLKSARPDTLKGYTDEQLASAVKSRYIQSAADMQDYMRTVMMNMDEEVANIQMKLAEQQNSQGSTSQESESSTE